MDEREGEGYRLLLEHEERYQAERRRVSRLISRRRPRKDPCKGCGKRHTPPLDTSERSESSR